MTTFTLTNTQVFARIATQAQSVISKVENEGLRAGKAFAIETQKELLDHLDNSSKNGAGFMCVCNWYPEVMQVRSKDSLIANMRTVINKANEQIRKA